MKIGNEGVHIVPDLDRCGPEPARHGDEADDDDGGG
jgi:hypothetical protein